MEKNLGKLLWPRTIMSFLDILKKYKKKIAIETQDTSISYGELIQKSYELVNYFLQKGLKKKDIILVQLPNCQEFIYCYIACMLGGFIILPTNTETDLRKIKEKFKKDKIKIFIKKKSDLKYIKNNFQYKKFRVDESNIMSIFLTTGTTSAPKAICHSSKDIVQNALAFNKHNKIYSSRFFHLFPMNYMAGFLNSIISPLVTGGTIILHEKFNIRFASNFSKIINKYKINYLWLNPTMVKTILFFQKKKANLGKNLKIFVATDALSRIDKIKFLKKFSKILLESYGMTEILLFSSQKNNTKNKFLSHVGSIISGNKIYKNKKKSLIVSSKYINKKYFDFNKKKFLKNFQINKFDTGDIYKYTNKNLYILGRKKNIIIKGGINISPEYIENSIRYYKLIENCCVISQPDQYYIENICLVIKTLMNKKIDIKKFENFLTIKLDKNYFPKKILQVDNIPLNNNKKIDRKLLINNIEQSKIKILYEKIY